MSHDNRMTPFDWFLVAVAVACALALASCSTTRESKAQTDTVRQETTTIDCTIPFPVILADGMHMIDIPIHLVMKRDSQEVAKTAASSESKLNMPEITGAIGIAIKGALAQFAPGLAAMSAPASKDYTREIIEGLVLMMTAAGGVGVVREKNRQIEFHKNDAAVAYKKLGFEE